MVKMAPYSYTDGNMLHHLCERRLVVTTVDSIEHLLTPCALEGWLEIKQQAEVD
jgi:hypothetical protein